MILIGHKPVADPLDGDYFSRSLLNFFISSISGGEIFSLLSYFDRRNKILLCCGYSTRIAESILPRTSSFVGRSAFILAGALSLVGFFLMITSNVANLPCEMLFAFTALACRPSNCFLLRPPRLQYCWYRLFTNSDPGWVCTISFNMSNRISILVVVKIANL